MTDTASSAGPNWYLDPHNPSILRWWDGHQWTDHVQPAQIQAKPSLEGLFSKGIEAAKEKMIGTVQGVIADNTDQQDTTSAGMGTPLYVFTSHIEGKNAKVEIYVDRIEWERPRGVSGAKIAAAVMTAGMSLAVTGVKSNKNAGAEMIPVEAISSVITRRDGMINSVVTVICEGNAINFRCAHNEAAQAKSILTQLALGSHPAQIALAAESAHNAAPIVVQVQTPPASPSSAFPSDPMEQLTKLKSLLDAGLVTQEEYNTKKAQILEQL